MGLLLNDIVVVIYDSNLPDTTKAADENRPVAAIVDTRVLYWILPSAVGKDQLRFRSVKFQPDFQVLSEAARRRNAGICATADDNVHPWRQCHRISVIN